MKKSLIILASITVLIEGASAQQLMSRADYNTFTAGGTSNTDDFEGYNIGDGNATVTSFSTLDSTTFDGSNGPGLVGSGASYSSADGSNLQWNGNGYYGLNTKTIVANYHELDIHYTAPVQAFGIDLAAYSGFPDSFTATVYDGANQVGQFTGSLAGPISVFAGWSNTAGITSVSLISSGYYWSPIIDNSSYGNAAPVPEPASIAALALGGLGLIRRRRAVR